LSFFKSNKRRNIFFFTVLILAVLCTYCFVNLGRWLVADDEPVKSDVIVVLMGSGPDRMLGAVDLYQQGMAGKIIMVRNYVSGYEEALSRGVEIPHDSDIAAMVAVQLGVDADDIIILPGGAGSTGDEARVVADYFREHEELDSLLVVTSKYHSHRAKMIFSCALDELDREASILSCPTPYDHFQADGWWQRRGDMEIVFLEYVKLAHFFCLEQFSLVY